MNGYGITRVHYRDPQAKDYIEAVKVVEFEEYQGRIEIKKEWQWTRKTLLREVEFNRDVFVLFDLNELGPCLKMVEIDSKQYIRTDQRKEPHDFLDGLPEF